ncbi:fumarylacetoacetate hydrolase family protein [Spelaeicoccus albus]|uniref:2-keto-4-pentenoate hydratase/2-oxohepta-3-ene-1,7-dioic acid hydratase in catechol pathway n=1 Tax=Spelaeicoccus albus TaxID=1280376 RepID=A0A7Z0D2K9_9MICO|nr:fumarylacetoacetate hydrolase family protein [Spelaeicoccus albus]NYI67710.1 2-keto-4-pentenoate hydratase/2-oxohepta-3-ene-1,7-dioic acid hydratase in catechol pathway [Spelaeicoccus albus]
MRIARFILDDEPHYGVVEGDPDDAAELVVLSGDPFFSPAQPTGRRVPADDVRLLAPIIPRSKVVGIGRNYADHAAELGNEVPAEPLMFFKPNTAVIGPDDPIRLPAVSEYVSYEVELAVVISRIGKNVPVDKADDHILGYTIANDVTLRDLQKSDGQWSRAKGFDTSCPIGPWIETELDVSDLGIRSWVDDELKQDGRTSQLVHGIPELISYVSETITLLPGDIILTGTPAGVGQITDGQRVTLEIERIGRMSNPVLDA